MPEVTIAHVKLRLGNDRAKRFVKDEADHFTPDYVNILIADVRQGPRRSYRLAGPPDAGPESEAATHASAASL
jgi:hypothetical protein